MGTSTYEYPPLITKIENSISYFEMINDSAERYIDEKVALIGFSAHRSYGLGIFSENISLNDAALLANSLI
jgi:hypothetical protein